MIATDFTMLTRQDNQHQQINHQLFNKEKETSRDISSTERQ